MHVERTMSNHSGFAAPLSRGGSVTWSETRYLTQHSPLALFQLLDIHDIQRLYFTDIVSGKLIRRSS